MILGVGVDIIDIRRVGSLLEKNEDRFIERTFTKNERDYADSKPAQRIAIFAKRFAAKEAFAKAMGTGMGEAVSFKEIEVINDNRGRPLLRLFGKAANWIGAHNAQAHLSLSDEADYAVAYVIIEERSAQD